MDASIEMINMTAGQNLLESLIVCLGIIALGTVVVLLVKKFVK